MRIPFEERLHFIVTHYGIYNKESLMAATLRIQKRLGKNRQRVGLSTHRPRRATRTGAMGVPRLHGLAENRPARRRTLRCGGQK